METLEKYAHDVQAEIDALMVSVYRYEGALAMIRKMQDDLKKAQESKQAENHV